MKLTVLCIRFWHLIIVTALSAFASLAPTSNAIGSLTPDFVNEQVLSGLNQPVDLAFLPDGRALILLKDGEIVITDPQASPPVASTYMTLTDIESASERGLTAIALDPDFATNNHFYLYYTNGSRSRFRVSRFTHSGNTADPGTEFLVWENPQIITTCCHFGGGLSFGPDGALYLTTGDTFEGGQSQDLRTANGKVLRFYKDGLIPTDNPFWDGLGPNMDEIWALGLRNAFRATWDLPSGRLYIAEVGGNDQSSSWEDIHLGLIGANYGWPYCEGYCSGNPEFDGAFYAYPHSGSGASITGGFVYRGAGFPPGMQGAYFFADYVRQWIRYFTLDASGNVDQLGELDTAAGDVVALKEGPDGALYYLDILAGSVRRIVYLLANQRPTIDSAIAIDPQGQAPHTVTFSGSASDPENSPLVYTWIFGDGQQAEGADVSHQYVANGPYKARLLVSDGSSSVFSDDIDITIGIPPSASISSPGEGDLFRAGDVITYSGSGNDPDGVLGSSNFEWTIDFHHNEHTHPGETSLPGYGGTYQIDDAGHDFSDDTGYIFTLTVTDADGLSASDSVTVYPDKVNVTFETNPPMDALLLDGIAKTTPFVHDTLIGFNHDVSVPAEICIDGTSYVFLGWTDGGAAQHIFTVPNVDTTLTAMFSNAGPCPRVTDGLQVLYEFSAASGSFVLDRSGNTPALDLTIENTANATWLANGGLSIDAPTLLSTSGAATRLSSAIQASGEVTIEAWLRPADMSGLTTYDPARIVALSQNGFPDGGNLILGQTFIDSSDYIVRLRTSSSNQYGSPDFFSPTYAAIQQLTHVVYTRNSSGQESLYLNGVEVVQGSRPGALNNWGDYGLSLANEPDGLRPWLGEFRLVAIYDRALDNTEIDKNFKAGAVTGPPPVPTLPDISSQPLGKTVLEGQPASFTVVASGTAPLSYQWERDFVPLTGETNATLNLVSVSLSDNGAAYRCVVSNDLGSTTSEIAILTVTPVDTDGDGLPDALEIINGTNPNSVDSDGDGLVDGAGGVVDVNDYPGGIDIDGDSFVDGELDLGTDPAVSNLGDVAPRNSPDNLIDLGDLLVLTRLVTGAILPSDLEKILGDINGDTQLNTPDILLLQKAVLNGTTP